MMCWVCLSAVSRIEAVTTTGQMGSVIRLKQFLEVTEVQKVTALSLALVLFKQERQRYFAHS